MLCTDILIWGLSSRGGVILDGQDSGFRLLLIGFSVWLKITLRKHKDERFTPSRFRSQIG